MSKPGRSSTVRMLMLGNRVGLPKSLIRTSGRVQASWLRRVGGRGPFSADLLILTTRGRTSGRPPSTCILFVDHSQHRYIVGSFGGSERAPWWYLNVIADPHVTVELNGERSAAMARELSPDEAESVWPAMDEVFPPFADYRARVSRPIPLIELAAE